jgi:hypothetical protein
MSKKTYTYTAIYNYDKNNFPISFSHWEIEENDLKSDCFINCPYIPIGMDGKIKIEYKKDDNYDELDY